MKRSTILFFLIIIFQNAVAQDNKTEGFVIDKQTLKPIKGVAIIDEKQTFLCDTDAEGRFVFNNVGEKIVIKTLHLNYNSFDTVIKSPSQHIVLKLDLYYKQLPSVIASQRTSGKPIKNKPNAIIFNPPNLPKGPRQINNGTIIQIVQRDADFYGGHQNFINYIINSFDYPQESLINGAEGTVDIRFAIDKEGKTHDIEIKGDADPFLMAEAKRLIDESPMWIPAWDGYEKAKFYYSIKMSFNLNNYWSKKRKALIRKSKT